jgi:hypothetical protein
MAFVLSVARQFFAAEAFVFLLLFSTTMQNSGTCFETSNLQSLLSLIVALNLHVCMYLFH